METNMKVLSKALNDIKNVHGITWQEVTKKRGGDNCYDATLGKTHFIHLLWVFLYNGSRRTASPSDKPISPTLLSVTCSNSRLGA